MSTKLFLHGLFSVLFAGLILIAGLQVANAQTQPSHLVALEVGADSLAPHHHEGLAALVAGLPNGTVIVIVGYAAHGEAARPAAGLAAARALHAAHTLAAVAANHGVTVTTSVEARQSPADHPTVARIEFHIQGTPAAAQLASR